MRQLKIAKQVTNRETASLDKYLHDIAKKEMVTAEEEVELTNKIKQGDQVALDRLVSANLRFVVSVAKQYQNQGLTLSDLINEGNIGLIKAAKRFDETRGFKFISYAVWWIRQSILQALADQARVVRLPLNKIGTIGKMNKAYSKIEQDLGRTPTAQEISDYMEISLKDVKQAMQSSGKHVSMDAPLVSGDDNSSNMYDLLQNTEKQSPDNVIMKESLEQEIERSLSTLKQREASIIRLYYGLGGKASLTLEEIGDLFELTRERVRQIKEKGIRRMRQASRSRMLKAYLG
ncbi:RNA polymerase subunit sigma [Putridiphycobacter roseus]|uniref:RNA polymerase subunit sigma n=1 Tax=Putridiphycobacter roseus TaxID=2219161 RepID=A0A2W1NF98_9FLAO|nr:RNA polymerase sigma factor RpoD/SigA [Putridiphycobacter roseus]PZE17773.1 RNA polymerase subunit sigma [Putridiphycobacter roseus]